MRKKKILYSILAVVLAFVAGFVGVGVFAMNGADYESSVTVTNEAEGVQLDWAFNINAKGYHVYRWNAEEREKVATISRFRKTAFVDTTAVNGQVYKYSVCAFNDEGTVAETRQAEIMRIETPEILSVKNGARGIDIAWKKIEGVEAYAIYREYNGERTLIAKHDPQNPCEYTDTQVVGAQRYKYSVIATVGKYVSGYDTEKSDPYIPAPENINAVNENGWISVTWDKVAEADSYILYRKTNGSKWKFLGSFNSEVVGYTDRDIVSGNVYTYTLRALSDDIYSGFDSYGVSTNYVDLPVISALTNADDCIKITWKPVSNATQYRVYKKIDGVVKWNFVGECTGTSFTDADIGDGVNYRYTVRAVGDKGGLSAQPEGGLITALKMPEINLYCTTKAINVKWGKMPLATAYRVYKKAGNAKGWSLLATVSGDKNNYVDKQVKAGVNYTYTVRQVYSSMYGSYNSGTSTRFDAAPKVTAKLSPKGLKLEWNKANAGSGYIIDRRVEGSTTWSTIGVVNGLGKTTYTDSAAKYGKINYYRVRVDGTNRFSDTASIYGIDPTKPAVALTYDDGPHPTVTHHILDVLERYDARATFFVVGSRVTPYADCVERASKLGCEIGNHTTNHKILTSADNKLIASEISKTNSLVKNITGKAPTIVRAPGGSFNNRVKSQVNAPLIQWSVDTLDWKNRNASSVIKSVKSSTRDGSIILMHDLYTTTAEATETIVPWLIKEGYQLVTVTELMQLKGIDMENGSVYYSGS